MTKKVKIIIVAVAVVSLSVGAYFYLRRSVSNTTFHAELPANDQATPAKNTANVEQPTPELSDFVLSIAKIGITAPVTLNVDGNNKDEYLKSLEQGIDHLKGTPLPGEAGNSVIFGHSSYFANKPGSYKDIFAKLNNLAAGDLIVMKSKNITYTYKITDKKIIGSKDLTVLASTAPQKTLTLLTCWPVGTINQRLAVQAILQ
jgi:sortase A